MRANRITFYDRDVKLSAFELPSPKENEVVIKVKYSLISNGTEKACLSGEPNSVNIPMRYGYSSVGYVVETGKKVTSVKAGDRVFATYTGHANYGVRPVSNVTKIPDEVYFEDAVFVKIASFPLLALRKSQYVLGELVVVVGTGLLGLLGVRFAYLSGAMPLIAIGGSRQDRLDKAREFGAEYVFSANEPDLEKKIISITQKSTFHKGAEVVIETTGQESALFTAFKYVGKNARIVINGCNRRLSKPIDLYNSVHIKGTSLIGANSSNRPSGGSMPFNWTTARDYKLILEYMKNDKLNAKSLISEYADPNDCVLVFERLLNDRDFPLGVVFDWDKL